MRTLFKPLDRLRAPGFGSQLRCRPCLPVFCSVAPLSLYASQPVTVTGRGSRRSHRHFLASELLQSFPLRMEEHCSNTLSGHTTQKYHHWHDKDTNIVGREKSTSPRLARRLISKTVIPREPLIQM